MPVRIVLADDHPIVRSGLRTLLESEPGLAVIGEATNGREALEMAARLRPDLLLLDVSMPQMTGIEALREMAASSGGVRTILLTASLDRAGMLEAVQLGARGIVPKTAGSAVLVEGIRAVAQGDFWLDRTRHSNFTEVIRSLKPTQGHREDRYTLTGRQREIVKAVIEGLNNREIAQRCGISEHTVKHHLTQIFNKTGVSTRLELALLATHQHLLEV
jgi:two-component system nitrate/nitrite response regulator NarL